MSQLWKMALLTLAELELGGHMLKCGHWRVWGSLVLHPSLSRDLQSPPRLEKSKARSANCFRVSHKKSKSCATNRKDGFTIVEEGGRSGEYEAEVRPNAPSRIRQHLNPPNPASTNILLEAANQSTLDEHFFKKKAASEASCVRYPS